jgi:hypothetical protein
MRAPHNVIVSRDDLAPYDSFCTALLRQLRMTGPWRRDVAPVSTTSTIMGPRPAGMPSDEILVSATVMDLFDGSGLNFEDAGIHELKVFHGQRQLYRLIAPEPA